MNGKTNKISAWFKAHKPTKRRLIQFYSALLYNANIKGFVKGEIYKGNTKNMCVPGLNCYSCPGAVGACPLGSLQNAFASSNLSSLAYIFGIFVLFGLILGRTICSFLCPFGLIQELLHKIPSPKLKKSPVTRTLSYFKYVILAVFVVGIPLVYAGAIPIPGFCKYICPSGTLLGSVSLLSNSATGETYFSMLGPLFTWKFCLLVIFLVASVFVYRFFCRFFCPLGAIYGFFSKIALLGVKLDDNKCIGCGLCVSECKMDIRHVGDRECINCGECISVCPTKAISWKGSSFVLHQNDIAKTENKPETAEKDNKRLKIIKITSAAVALSVLCGALVYYNFIDVEKDNTEAGSSSDETDVSSSEGNLKLGYEIGDICPDFSLPGLDGDPDFKLSDNNSDLVVVNFWATWCGPCLAELPEFEQIAEEYPNITVLAVHYTPYTEGFLQKREGDWTKWNINFVLDTKQENGKFVCDALGKGDVLPITVVLNKEGVIVSRLYSRVEYEELKKIIEENIG